MAQIKIKFFNQNVIKCIRVSVFSLYVIEKNGEIDVEIGESRS